MLWVLTQCVPAYAGKWPHPAAGDSASGDPEVLLTFDDGPHEKYTPIILDALRKRGLQAIFFWTGARINADGAKRGERLEIMEQAVRDGHLIGNHTYSHAKLCVVSKSEAAREIDRTQEIYSQLLRMPFSLFRVPYGARCKRLDRILSERNIEHLHWDLDPQEFLHHSSDIAFAYVSRKLRRLKDGKRAVLLMHDTKPATARAIPKILRWIDEENSRRISKGRRPIRIISASNWYEEKYPAPLFRWAQVSGRNASNRLLRALATLVPGSEAQQSATTPE